MLEKEFFHGLPKDMRTNLRIQFDSGATYYQMLELARIVESENFHESSGNEAKTTSNKGKSKINLASVHTANTVNAAVARCCQGFDKVVTK